VGPREARGEHEVVGDLDVVRDVEDPDVLALLLIGEESGCGGELLGFDDGLRTPRSSRNRGRKIRPTTVISLTRMLRAGPDVS
jgi:hypothetical protein